MELGGDGSGSDLDEGCTIHFWALFELFQELECAGLGNVESFADDTRVDAFLNVSLCLLEELTDEKNNGGGTITTLLILCNGCSSDHSGGRVLDLHFSKKNLSILGHFEVTGAIDKHLDGTTRTQVGTNDLGQTDSTCSVDLKSLCPANRLGSRVDELDGRHGCCRGLAAALMPIKLRVGAVELGLVYRMRPS